MQNELAVEGTLKSTASLFLPWRTHATRMFIIVTSVPVVQVMGN